MNRSRFSILLRSFRLLTVKLFHPVIDELLVLLQIQFFIVRNRRHYRFLTHRLFFRVTELRQIWMPQCLLRSQSFIWIKLQHFIQ